MNNTLRNICAVGLIVLFALPALAQLNGSGFYRFRNVANTNDYISIANDKFNYTTCISTACGGLSQAYSSAGQARAMACVGKYLSTDIHMVNDNDLIIPGAVIYADKKNYNASNYDYNLIGQGTSLLTLTAGTYPGTLKLKFYDNYITIKRSSGSGATTQYTASIVLKAQNNALANLGTRYFVDDNGTFAVNTSSSATNAKWYIEPVDHFNVVPEVEFNGKYYTTIKVPYAFMLSGSVEKAYTITAVNNGVLAYDEIAVEGDSVPAGTPVILECGSANPADCQLIPMGIPIFTAPNQEVTSNAPVADESSSYAGTNLLGGTYYCNTDGTIMFDTPSGANVGSFNANHITAVTSNHYVLGITSSGKLGFVKATGSAMPANKAWLILSAEAEFPWELPVTVAAPVISPASGAYNGAQTVTITTEDQDATILYKVNDGEYQEYTEPFIISENCTITAKASKNGHDSEETAATYTITLPTVETPTFSPAAGEYIGEQNVTIACATEGAIIHYTTDGSEPTTESAVYNEPITVSESMTIKAIAVKQYYINSAIAEAAYTILPPVAVPVISPASGAYNGAQTVTITTEDQDATILFKVNDGEYQEYTEPFIISENCTITAKAVRNGYDSEETAATYTITLPTVETPTFSPAAGEYIGEQNVTIACATEGAIIHYTTDGSEPTTESAVYNEPITVSESMTIKAIAVKQYYINSAIAEAAYTILPPRIPGDVNRDGVVDITDVTATISFALEENLDNPVQYDYDAADIDQNGIIDITDVTSIIAIALSSQGQE